ncbi:hypothetical protein ACFX15_006270 [Malus domestica]
MGDVSHLSSVFLGDVSGLISTFIRSALDCSLNYARSYLTELLPLCVCCVVYLDFSLILVDDIAKLFSIPLLAAPEYYNANFTSYFISAFLSNPSLSITFADRHACYFNTGLLKCNGGDAKGDYCSLRAVTVHWVDNIVYCLGGPFPRWNCSYDNHSGQCFCK